MQTDELIVLLSDGLTPAPRHAVGRHLAFGLLTGLVFAAALMLLILKPRADLAAAMAGGLFWLKLGYVLALGALGLWLTGRQARPGADTSRPMTWLALPIALMSMAAAVQLSAANADTAVLVMGSTAAVCPFLILMLAVPLLLTLLLAMRRLAPTRLSLAGAGAGLAAGGWAAAVYAFHCPESAAPFILIWYSLGVALSAGLGALLGPVSLRW